MTPEMDPSSRQLMRKYVKERLSELIVSKMGQENIADAQDVADEIVKSKEVNEMIKKTRKVGQEWDQNEMDDHFNEDNEGNPDGANSRNWYIYLEDSDDMDQIGEDWDKNDVYMNKNQLERSLSAVLEKISNDQPVHVRLAGFETLMKGEFVSSCDNETFALLLKSLRDGISDDKKPVFEASLKIHSRLLESPRSHEIYSNLITSFETEYSSKRLHDTLPNFNSGINFKIFIHEKLIRILYLIVRHQREVLKIMRSSDRTVDEMIDQFVVLLICQNVSNPSSKIMSTLNLISLLEPRGNWCKKLIHSITTRKSLMNAISKSPNLLEMILEVVKNGLKEAPTGHVAYSISDEPIHSRDHQSGTLSSVFISGETVETITYIHCLNIVSQLCNYFSTSYSANISADSPLAAPPSPIDFAIALLNSLNSLVASTGPKSLYNESLEALRIMLQQPSLPCDSRLFHVAMAPLVKPTGSNANNISASHTIDVIDFILEAKDGIIFFLTPCLSGSGPNRNGSSSQHPEKTFSPASCLILHASDLLEQPLAVMNVEHILRVLTVIGKLCQILPDLEIIAPTLVDHFFPTIEYFYSKIDKYAIVHENKTQNLDSAVKKMLLKLASWPLGLWLLSKQSLVFEELVRTSINPLRYSWKSNEIVYFVSSAAFFDLGYKNIAELVPRTLSMFLSEVCCNMDDAQKFYDPWDSENVGEFLHVLALISLSTKCFMVFMMDFEDEESSSNGENISHPQSFCQLLKFSMFNDSPYHCFSLLSLDVMIWNLDILIYLLNAYDLQTKLLNLQEGTQLEVTKYIEKTNDNEEEEEEEEGKDETSEDYIPKNIDNETHVVYVVDECSALRHRILSKSYYIRHKLEKQMTSLRRNVLFSSFPPPETDDEWQRPQTGSTIKTELDDLLQECKPGLRDSGWLTQIRKAYKNSPGPMKHSTLRSLLQEMGRAISTVDWVDMFKWDTPSSTYCWQPQEDFGLDMAVRYAEDQCKNLKFADQFVVRNRLKQVFEAVHGFIGYEKPVDFEGFDWFISTVFVLCDGEINQCKEFMRTFVRFPSAMYMWRELGNTIDQINDEKLTTQFLIAQHIETVVSQELPVANYVLKNEYGLKWWIICNQMLSQCFWGILEWSEIMHFLAICVLNPPDYIVYYCVSLLHHCEPIIMQDTIDRKSWPENLDLSGYHCHDHLNFIDRLGKKYQNNILPSLTQRKSLPTGEEKEQEEST